MYKNTNIFKIKVIFLMTLLLIISSILFAQDDRRMRKISISAEETPISSLLVTMSNLSGCDIVLTTDVPTGGDKEERITLKLHDKQFETALAMVVQAAGLSYRYYGENTYQVGPRERLRSEVGERSFYVPLSNVTADKIARAFDAFGGNVKAVEGQNALMIYANPETYNDIMARINEMDVPQVQIEIRVRMIEVSLKDTKQLGIDWFRISHLTTIIAEDPTNGDGIGLPYNYLSEDGEMPSGGTHPFETLPQNQYFQKIDGFKNVGHFSRQLTAFDITLDWLMQNNAAKLLTDTRLIAVNGEEGEIFIGEVVPYVNKDGENEMQVEREEAGIKLSVKPSMNKDGLITCNISPEVSNITELVNGYLPRTRVRRVSTTVTVPDGLKFHIGGLIHSVLNHKTTKVPFLGDLPFIGKLFQHQFIDLETSDLVIEITPRVVNVYDEQYDYEIDERLGRELIKIVSDDEDDNNNS